MSPVYSVVVLVTVALVVLAVFATLWRERASSREGWIAVASAVALAVWAATAAALARGGFFQAGPGDGFPPLGISLTLTLLALSACLFVSPSLRGMLSRQSSLIRLHLWRFFGLTFLVLMIQGQLPALFALPAGIGDALVAATAPWVARGIGTPRGRRRAIIWNLLGMADLIVAVGLGVTTNPGPAQVFHTVPDSQILTSFPMALVPAFLVPLAFTFHGISLWQLLGRRWAHNSTERRQAPRGWIPPAPIGERTS